MATNNPIGSQAPEDFKFNVANVDRAMNSDAATFQSREASDQPARAQFTWAEIQRRAVVEISAAEQAKVDAQAARDAAQAIAETLAAVKIYQTYAAAEADLPNLVDGDNVEINQDETTDGLRTRYVVVAGALADKTILSTVVNTTATPVVDTAAWEDVPVLESTPATIAAALNTVAQKLAKRTRWLYEAVAAFDISVLVQKTSPTGAAILPEGDDAERPAEIPAEGGLTRANNTAGDYFLEFRNRASSGWEALASRLWVRKNTMIAGQHKNLRCSATGTNSLVSVSADQLVLENAAGEALKVRDVSISIDAATGGTNGLDTGVLAASTWYSVWVISDGVNVRGLISLSATAPTTPAGYTYKANVWSTQTDGTANKYPLRSSKINNDSFYDVASGSNVTGARIPISGVQGSPTTPTYVEASLSAFVPEGAVGVFVSFTPGGIASNTNAAIAPTGGYGAFNSTTNPPFAVLNASATDSSKIAPFYMPLSAGRKLFFANNNAAIGVALRGWRDAL